MLENFKEEDSKQEDYLIKESDESLSQVDSTQEENIDNQKEEKLPDYDNMDLDKLIFELKRETSEEKIQQVKKKVNLIKDAFLKKFKDQEEEKKETFLAEGGNIIDFSFYLPVKSTFDNLYGNYKSKLKTYYQDLEKTFKENLKKRLIIIEEIKGLISRQDHINIIYKEFLELQKKWRSTGYIPKAEMENIWQTYRHNVDLFYDFLGLHSELRDKDFQHNLEEKQKLVKRVQELDKEENVVKAFRELQFLHKVWRKDIGPVSKEYREDIWERFCAASKVINEKKQNYLEQLEAEYENNFKYKNTLLDQMENLSNPLPDSHKDWQAKIKKYNTIKDNFLKIGRVPKAKDKAMWKRFREVNSTFIQAKNDFYVSQKKMYKENLEKKQQFIEKAKELKDSDDFENTTPIIIQLQKDWKDIGHVPYKYSDKVWNEFRGYCNAYFDRIHTLKNKEQEQVWTKALEAKQEILDKLKSYQPEEGENVELFIKEVAKAWLEAGQVSTDKKDIEKEFDKTLENLIKELGNSYSLEGIKYHIKLMKMPYKIVLKEREAIHKKIESITAEKLQLENNMSFINTSKDNPLVIDIKKRTEAFEKELENLIYKKKKIQFFINKQ